MPSVKGLATIYDKDILIYCISQLMAKLKRGEPVGPRLRITSHELLVFTNRATAGKDYEALCEAIDRLARTRITTNIQTGDEEQTDSFGLIDSRVKQAVDETWRSVGNMLNAEQNLAAGRRTGTANFRIS